MENQLENGSKTREKHSSVGCLVPAEPHDLGKTFFNVFDKRARWVWTSLDPTGERGLAGFPVMDLYPEEVRDAAWQKISAWLVNGEGGAYTVRALDWPKDGPDRLVNVKVTLLPFDHGDCAGISIATVLPDNYHEITDDDRAVLRLMADDHSLREIAQKLHRSESAIDGRVKALKEKLNCNTIGGLVATALRSHVI